MQKKINYWAIFAVAMTILCIIVGSIALKAPSATIDDGVTQEDLDLAVSEVASNKDVVIQGLMANIEALNSNVEVTDAVTAEVVNEETISSRYTIDELNIGDSVDEELTDREVSLFDGDVDFDDEEYGAEETLFISGMYLTTNEEDFNADVYSVIKEGDLEYVFEFDSDLDTSLIGVDEEYLVFNLLGKEVEVAEWDVDKLTFRYGTEVLAVEGVTFDHEGHSVVLSFITDDSV